MIGWFQCILSAIVVIALQKREIALQKLQTLFSNCLKSGKHKYGCRQEYERSKSANLEPSSHTSESQNDTKKPTKIQPTALAFVGICTRISRSKEDFVRRLIASLTKSDTVRRFKNFVSKYFLAYHFAVFKKLTRACLSLIALETILLPILIIY